MGTNRDMWQFRRAEATKTGREVTKMSKRIREVIGWMGAAWGDQRGITGLETAIILIAFVVVASVFAFAVLTTGLLSSDKARDTTLSALKQAQSTLAVRGVVVGVSNPGNTSLVSVRFQLNNANSGSDGIELSASSTIFSYQDADQFMNLGAADWTATWLIGSGPVLDPGEAVDVDVDLTTLSPLLGGAKEFTVQVKPSLGAVLMVNRTTPPELRPIVDLG